MRVTTLLPILLISLAGVLPAAATGTVECIAEDAAAEIDVQGVVPYGMGSPLVQVSAEILAELPGISPDLSGTRFGMEHQAQYWLDDTTLNLLFYKERQGVDPFGSTTLTIKTTHGKDDEEGAYWGSYVIDSYEMPDGGGEAMTVQATGRIACFAG